VIVESAFSMGECDDCQTESRLPMLVPWVWAKIAPGVVHDVGEHKLGCGQRCQCGVLCQSCAERRLQRELTSGDFQDGAEMRMAARGMSDKYERNGNRLRSKPDKFTRVRRRR